MNLASASEAQTQQRSLNSNLGDIVGVSLGSSGWSFAHQYQVYSTKRISAAVVHLCYLCPMVHHICHVTDFGQSHFAMHSILLPRQHTNSSQTSTVGLKAKDLSFWMSDKSLRFCIAPTIAMFSEALTHPLYTLNCSVLLLAFCDWIFEVDVESTWWLH
ncbi:uncharacterized protein TNCV_1383711 [Trichonephila clavipes]|nr:uncharacterized protein TNCV_1383711 [Trichonephila clavipes]